MSENEVTRIAREFATEHGVSEWHAIARAEVWAYAVKVDDSRDALLAHLCRWLMA